ncbi:MAG: parallel beta-helix domain-containing protein, partial [Balneolaceae bacterium]|nr:parallel beta-helix domain-containing protein [Balneolaceae bacterium]
MNSRAFSGAELQASQSKARLVVKPGESIQAAVDAAKPHQTILIEPGTYREAIVVDKPGLKLIGKKDPKGDGVVIENPGYKRNGIRVTDNGDGFRLARVTIKDFGYNGVLLTRVRGFEIFEVTTIDNGEYGLFPVHSSHGLIHHSSASGHSDTGIYVGKSEFVAIQHSTAHGNVNGFEIENCSHVTAFNNTGYNNTAGMLVVLLPGLAIKVSSDIEIVHNRFFNNNLANFADPDDIAAAVPKGSGILVVGTDNTRVMQNTVTGNDFVGIGVGSTLLLSALAGIPPEVIL